MAKKQTPPDQTHTLSTRLSADQKRTLEQAAEACNVTTAKFLREAAMKHAADVLTAKPNEALIRHLAAQMVKLLTTVTGESYAECIHDGHGPDTNPLHSATGRLSIDQMIDFGYDREHFHQPKNIKIDLLGHKDRQDLLTVMAAAPRAFAAALQAEFTKPAEERPSFKPVDIGGLSSD